MAEQGNGSGNLTASFLGSSDMIYDIECDVCLEDDKHLEATGFCVECHEYLCSDCVKAHGKSRLSKNHVVQNKSQMPRQKPPRKPSAQVHQATSSILEPCDLHQTRFIEYYCRDDDALACSVCFVEHRQCRAVDHVSNISEHMLDSQEYKHFTDSLTSLQNKSKDVIKNAKDNTIKSIQLCTDVTSDLHGLRKDVIQAFDKLDDDIKKKSDTIKLADLKKIKDISDKGKDDLSEVDQISTEIQTLQSKSQLDQLFVRMIKLKDRVQTLQNGIDEADRNNTVTTYKFNPGAAAQDFIDKPESFGTLSKQDSATGVNQTPELSEMTRQQLVDKIVALNKENADITEQLRKIACQGKTLSEELVSTKKDVDRINSHLQRVNNEKETLVQEKAKLIGLHELEKKKAQQAYDKMQNEYKERLSGLQRDSDNAIRKAEKQRQQAMSQEKKEKSTLQQRNATMTKELAAANVKYEQLKSESQTRLERDKSSISDLQSEIKNLREVNKKEFNKLTSQIHDVERQREAAAQQCDDLKARLKLAEEALDNINKDLTAKKSGLGGDRIARQDPKIQEDVARFRASLL